MTAVETMVTDIRALGESASSVGQIYDLTMASLFALRTVHAPKADYEAIIDAGKAAREQCGSRLLASIKEGQ